MGEHGPRQSPTAQSAPAAATVSRVAMATAGNGRQSPPA